VIEGLILTPLPVIDTKGGDVMHAMKVSDVGFSSFGECYFSAIEHDAIKGWKLHRQMVLNLVVPVGSVKFVVYDDREYSITAGQFSQVVLSRENYGRLTVPPNLWLAFKGVGVQESLLLNVSSIPHDPNEVERRSLEEIDYNWLDNRSHR